MMNKLLWGRNHFHYQSIRRTIGKKALDALDPEIASDGIKDDLTRGLWEHDHQLDILVEIVHTVREATRP